MAQNSVFPKPALLTKRKNLISSHVKIKASTQPGLTTKPENQNRNSWPSPKSGPPMGPVRNPDHPCVQSGKLPYPVITMYWSHQTGPRLDPVRNPGPPIDLVRNPDYPWAQSGTRPYHASVASDWTTHGLSPKPGTIHGPSPKQGSPTGSVRNPGPPMGSDRVPAHPWARTKTYKLATRDRL